MNIVILANGEFPKSKICTDILLKSNKIICCDGAVKNLLNFGIEPYVIIGDLDSISKEIKEKYKNKIIHISDQNSNDLTKAVNWCLKNNINKFDILGATGKREDHSIANIALLSEYGKLAKTKILTDYGIFMPVYKSQSFDSYKGQQISIFSLTPNTEIDSKGLKYKLDRLKLTKWYMGSLNEAVSDKFQLIFDKGEIIIYFKY